MHVREGSIDYHVGYSPNENDEIREIFISCAKTGTQIEALARDGAILASIALQYGAPLDVIQKALTKDDRDYPATIVGVAVRLCALDAEKVKSTDFVAE